MAARTPAPKSAKPPRAVRPKQPDGLRGQNGRNLGREVGTTGLIHYSGQIQYEFLTQLREPRRRYRLYREMADNDPVIGAMRFAIDSLCRDVTWSVVAEERADDEIAVFDTQCLHDMETSWPETLTEILTEIVYGWSWLEIVYKPRFGPDVEPKSLYDDGKVGWLKWAPRSQESLFAWDLAPNGEVNGFIQQDLMAPQQVTIPADKSLHFRTRVEKNNPEGQSALRNAFRPWYFKKRIEEIEAIGIERDLAGVPVAWAPAEIMSDAATPEQKAIFTALKEIVANLRNDEQAGLVLPLAYDKSGKELYKLELMSSSGQRQFDTTAVIQRYGELIAMTLLADFILLGHGNVGSFALSSSKTQMFGTAISSWLKGIAETITRQALPRLHDLNGLKPKGIVKVVPGDIKVPDLRELAMALAQLNTAGMPLFPDEILENHVRDVFKLPRRNEQSPTAPYQPIQPDPFGGDPNAEPGAPGDQPPAKKPAAKGQTGKPKTTVTTKQSAGSNAAPRP